MLQSGGDGDEISPTRERIDGGMNMSGYLDKNIPKLNPTIDYNHLTLMNKIDIFIVPKLQKIFAIFLSFLSIIIVWSEISLAINIKLSIFYIIANDIENDYFSILFGILCFGYMSVCIMFALFRIHWSRDYQMHPYQLTDVKSLLVNCSFAMRFMFPIGYNYLLMSLGMRKHNILYIYKYIRTYMDINICILLGKEEIKDKSFFGELFHDMSSLKIIGDPINTFLPLLILVFVLATLFNVYGKILKFCRISRYEFGDPKRSDEVRNDINEGINVVNKCKSQLKTDKIFYNQFVYELDRSNKILSKKLINIVLKIPNSPRNDDNNDKLNLIDNDQFISNNNPINSDNNNGFKEIPL